jgi:hypothetical protein
MESQDLERRSMDPRYVIILVTVALLALMALALVSRSKA